LGPQVQLLTLTTLATEDVARPLAAAIASELGDRVQIRLAPNSYARGWWELGVLDARATKARAISALRSAHGFVDAELVVFGDAENDLDMFHGADLAVAVDNAVPELRRLASHIVESNVADGVTRWLQRQHADLDR